MTHPTRAPRRSLLDVLLSHHPASLLGGTRPYRIDRRTEAELARLPDHLREDIGLPRLGNSNRSPGLEAALRPSGRWA